MAARTFGGWLIEQHGLRTCWHVQRLLMAWGVASMALGRRPLTEEVIEGGGVRKATYFRDLHHFKVVFPDRDPYEVWLQLYESRDLRRAAAVDVVQHAMWIG